MEQFGRAANAAGRVSILYVNALQGMLSRSNKSVPEEGFRFSCKNFMPRLGFACGDAEDRMGLCIGAGRLLDDALRFKGLKST